MRAWPCRPSGSEAERRLAPADDVFGKPVFRIVEAVLEEARVVDLGIARAQNEVGHGAAGAVARPAGLRVAVVGALQHREAERIAVHDGLAAGSAVQNDGAGAVLRLDLLDVLLDDVVGFVPRDAFPLVLAAILMGALHGVHDAVGMVHVLHQVQHLAVQAAAVNGMVLVSFHLQKVAVRIHRVLDTPPDGMFARRRPGTTLDSDGAIVIDALPLVRLCHTTPPLLSASRPLASSGHQSSLPSPSGRA